jgi:predicted HicB family RNase H-like nuclease
MAVSKAQQKAVAKYTAANYDELKVRIPKGRRADIDAYAKEHGCSVNSLVNDLLRDTVGMTESEWKEKADG